MNHCIVCSQFVDEFIKLLHLQWEKDNNDKFQSISVKYVCPQCNTVVDPCVEGMESKRYICPIQLHVKELRDLTLFSILERCREIKCNDEIKDKNECHIVINENKLLNCFYFYFIC